MSLALRGTLPRYSHAGGPMRRLKLRLMYTLGMLTPLTWVARHIERLDLDTAEALKHLFS